MKYSKQAQTQNQEISARDEHVFFFKKIIYYYIVYGRTLNFLLRWLILQVSKQASCYLLRFGLYVKVRRMMVAGTRMQSQQQEHTAIKFQEVRNENQSKYGCLHSHLTLTITGGPAAISVVCCRPANYGLINRQPQ